MAPYLLRGLLIGLALALLSGCVRYYYPEPRGEQSGLYFSGAPSHRGEYGAAGGYPGAYRGSPWYSPSLIHQSFYYDWASLSYGYGYGHYPWYGWSHPYWNYPYYWSAYPAPNCGAHWSPWRGYPGCRYHPWHGPVVYRSEYARQHARPDNWVLAAYPDADQLIDPPGNVPRQGRRDDQAGRGERPPNDFEGVINARGPAWVPQEFTTQRSGYVSSAGGPMTIRSRGTTKPGLSRPHSSAPDAPRPAPSPAAHPDWVAPAIIPREARRTVNPSSMDLNRAAPPAQNSVRSLGGAKPGVPRTHSTPDPGRSVRDLSGRGGGPRISTPRSATPRVARPTRKSSNVTRPKRNTRDDQ